jgi:hypothetical protein
MFAVNYFIDSVQSGKKLFVQSFITDHQVKSALNDFVDTQTAFVKQIFKSSEVIQKQVSENLKVPK